jgi:N-acetylglutamate synthase-like GNAT family acetyltransferase
VIDDLENTQSTSNAVPVQDKRRNDRQLSEAYLYFRNLGKSEANMWHGISWIKAVSLCFLSMNGVEGRFTGAAFQLRSATVEDVSMARKILFKQAMNPLSVSQKTLLVAYDETAAESPLLGFGQIRPLDDSYSELASLYVLSEHRHQGIGGAIVESLMKRHVESTLTKVCLLTLKPTTPFYEKYGFQVACEEQRKQLPSSLQMEFKLGMALSAVLGNDLVCMVQ